MTDHSIKGKTVLITGGAKNLGGLLIRDFTDHGVRVVALCLAAARFAILL